MSHMKKSTYFWCGDSKAMAIELLVPAPFWHRAAISGVSVPLYITIQEYGTEPYLFHLSYTLMLKINAFE